MTPEVWQRVCRVFEQVSELPVQRDEFLRQPRQSDGEVGSQVEALLGQHDAPSILESPPSKILARWPRPSRASAALPRARNGPPRSAPTSSKANWPAAAWASSCARPIPSSAGPWPSRSSTANISTTAVSANASSKRRSGITGQLQHPGIPPVYDMGRLADGRPFLAMKLIHGQTFAALLAACGSSVASSPAPAAASRRNSARCIDVFDQICQTMAYAHTRKVIHRDLKPGNIMVGASAKSRSWTGAWPSSLTAGGITVCGLASESVLSNAKPQPEGRTRAGSIMGSPAYIAPEQARGEVEYLDERCDVFGRRHPVRNPDRQASLCGREFQRKPASGRAATCPRRWPFWRRRR